MRLSPTTRYVLEGFVPYTTANLKLTYKPNAFFNELETKSQIKKRTLQSAYYRLLKRNLIELDENNIPRLTTKGSLHLQKYTPQKLTNAHLLIVFDIPEDERHKRDHLRFVLKELRFQKVQQSVWISEYDYRELLTAEIQEYQLQAYVSLYEACKI